MKKKITKITKSYFTTLYSIYDSDTRYMYARFA